MMSRAYVVTEGQADAKILEQVLPHSLVEDVKFVVAGGRSRAESLARSLLIAKNVPVALVFDADTSDEQRVNEEVDFLREYLDYGSGAAPSGVFPAVPEIEAILFEDKSLVERATGQAFSDREWELGKLQPKQLLSTVLPDRTDRAVFVLGSADEESIKRLREHPLARGLTEFLSSVLQDSSKS